MCKKTIYLDSKNGPNYRALINESVSGTVSAKLYSRDHLWTPPWKNKKLATLKDTSGEFEITIHRPDGDYKITMNISEFAYVRALAETLNRMGPTLWFDPLKPTVTLPLKPK